MNILTEQAGDWFVIQPKSRHLDAGNTSDFMAMTHGLVTTHPKVMIDMREVDFIDSSGVGSLLSCLRRSNESGGHLAVCHLSKTVKAVFDLMRMGRVFEIHAEFNHLTKAQP